VNLPVPEFDSEDDEDDLDSVDSELLRPRDDGDSDSAGDDEGAPASELGRPNKRESFTLVETGLLKEEGGNFEGN
jgi:hypothetical protein